MSRGKGDDRTKVTKAPTGKSSSMKVNAMNEENKAKHTQRMKESVEKWDEEYRRKVKEYNERFRGPSSGGHGF